MQYKIIEAEPLAKCDHKRRMSPVMSLVMSPVMSVVLSVVTRTIWRDLADLQKKGVFFSLPNILCIFQF
jgi:hypothetical protein